MDNQSLLCILVVARVDTLRMDFLALQVGICTMPDDCSPYIQRSGRMDVHMCKDWYIERLYRLYFQGNRYLSDSRLDDNGRMDRLGSQVHSGIQHGDPERNILLHTHTGYPGDMD